MELVPCNICGRNFSTEALDRHYNICLKNSKKVRKVFDSSKQRQVPEAPINIKNKRKPQQSIAKTTNSRKSNWRAKHEEFINTIRAAKGVTQALKEGKELPPPPPPAENPDYITCPHCERRFNEAAASRHIKFCAEQHKRLEVKLKVKTAVTSKLGGAGIRSRTKYTPPPINNRRSNSSTNAFQDINNKKPFSASKIKTNYTQSTSLSSRGKNIPTSAGSIKSTVRQNKNQEFKNNPDFVVDINYNSNGHGRTKTGLRPRVLRGDTSSLSNASEDLDSFSYTPSFAKDIPSKKAVSSEAVYSKSRYSSRNDDFKNSRRNNLSKQEFTGIIKVPRNKSSGLESPHSIKSAGNESLPIAAVAPVKMRSTDYTGFTENMFYEDYNYSPKFEPQHSKYAFSTNTNQQHAQGDKNLSKYCHECGGKYPITTAKFCCECGMKRLAL